MSNARKLQTEIDRVMKKVDEGVELFDDIWEKVYSTEQQNQKEKYEMDLKKEIKKLQRLRDQIKTWIGSSDVKDKEPLLEARKLIETKMEQFKICEKETKTKTYSKEGLARAEKLDPGEEAKRNTTAWIGEYVARLTQLVEDREVEIERLMAGKGKKTNKNIIDDFNQSIINHKYHVNKLEGIARLVNNDVLDTDAVDPLKEDLDYYMDSFEDEDYKSAYDEDFFYDALGLDELDIVNVDRVTNVGVVPPKQKGESDSLSVSTKDSGEKRNKKAGLSSFIPLTIGRARVSSGLGGPEKSSGGGSKSGRDDSSTGSNGKEYSNSFNEPTTIPAAVSSTTKTTPTKGPRAVSVGASVPAIVPATRAVPPAVAPGGASMAAILKRETEQQEKERQKARAQAEQLRQQQLQQQQLLQRQQQQQQQQQEAALRQQQEALQRQQEAALRQQQQQQQEAALRQQQQEAAAKQMQQQQAAVAAQQLQQQAAAAAAQQHAAQLAAQQQQAQQAAIENKKHIQQLQSQSSQGSTGSSVSGGGGLDILTSGLGGLNLAGVVGNMDVISSNGNNDPISIGSGLSSGAGSVGGGINSGNGGAYGAATPGSGSMGGVESGGGVGTSYLSALNEGFATMPNTTDNERSRQYTPQNPYPTPTSYPATPSGIFDHPAIFEKLGTDCLFFIFYYAQGTYQQYLAARELKKQSWRFHKKYMTWFQRHEEPKVTTDEYEQGTYVYFDYETGWCTRIKTDFRFEYSYLEDSLQ